MAQNLSEWLTTPLTTEERDQLKKDGASYKDPTEPDLTTLTGTKNSTNPAEQESSPSEIIFFSLNIILLIAAFLIVAKRIRNKFSFKETKKSWLSAKIFINKLFKNKKNHSEKSHWTYALVFLVVFLLLGSGFYYQYKQNQNLKNSIKEIEDNKKLENQKVQNQIKEVGDMSDNISDAVEDAQGAADDAQAAMSNYNSCINTYSSRGYIKPSDQQLCSNLWLK